MAVSRPVGGAVVLQWVATANNLAVVGVGGPFVLVGQCVVGCCGVGHLYDGDF